MMGSAIQSSERDALKPCPHCGTTEQLYLASRQMNGPVYAIDCVECGYDFEPRAGMDVVAAWNKRAAAEENAA